MRRVGLCLGILLLLSGANLYAQCGVERWSIKTGTDSGAPSINLSSWISTTIYNMLSSTRPGSLPSNSRVAPRETNQYSVGGTLIKYKRETDSDYHLVIKDGSGRTMIVELPSANCVGSGSPFISGIRNARAQFDAKLTATSTMKNVTAPVTIRGIGFWDFLHGQTGVAPNGIEVHPVLNIAFTGPITASEPGVVTAAETQPAVELPADMVEDNDGGRARVFRGGEPLGNVLFHGGRVVEDPRIRVLFAGNRWSTGTKHAIADAARNLSADPRFRELDRYGVRTSGIMVEARELPDEKSGKLAARAARILAGAAQLGEISGETTDLDVQRVLSNAVEDGQIQHLDENVVNVVVIDADTPLAVGTTRDWISYHSQFHPTELAMTYVVVRAGSDLEATREAMVGSVLRALIDPDGNGWF